MVDKLKVLCGLYKNRWYLWPIGAEPGISSECFSVEDAEELLQSDIKFYKNYFEMIRIDNPDSIKVY